MLQSASIQPCNALLYAVEGLHPCSTARNIYKPLLVVWRLLQALWKSLDLEWSVQLQPLVKALSSKLRDDMLSLVTRAYSNLSPGKLGVLLGLPEEGALQREYCTHTQYCLPVWRV